jgi:hypothetical protein
MGLFFSRTGGLGILLSLLLVGCHGAYQVSPDESVGAGGLKPTQSDRDAGRVGIAPGFDVKGYRVGRGRQVPRRRPGPQRRR